MCEENLILLTDAYWTFPGKATAAVSILQHMCRFVTGNLWDISTWGTAGLLSGTWNSQEWKLQGDVCCDWMLLSITLPGWTIWKQFWEHIHRNECSACHAGPAGMGFCEPYPSPIPDPIQVVLPEHPPAFSLPHTSESLHVFYRIFLLSVQKIQYSSSFGHCDAISEWWC